MASGDGGDWVFDLLTEGQRQHPMTHLRHGEVEGTTIRAKNTDHGKAATWWYAG